MQKPGNIPGQASKKLYINKSSVARALQTLENDGFIRRAQSETDRRMTLVYPTQKAEDIFPLICEVSLEWNRYLFEALDESEKEIFSELIEKIAKRATDYVDKEREGEK